MPTPGHRLVVSFHDLHPGSRGACERFLAQLAELGVTRTSLLVVPRWHGDAPFTDDPGFTRWLVQLAEAGHEICLHGWLHRADPILGGPWARLIGHRYTQGEGEFFQIAHDEALARVQLGLKVLAGDAGLPVLGFTPPAWLLSEAGREALIAAGMHYTTTWSSVELLRLGTKLAAPTLVYSCRSAWRRRASRAWVRVWARVHHGAPLLRIAAHPGDFLDTKVEASLLRLVRKAIAAGRVPITYRDLLPAGTAPLSAPAAAA